MQRLLKILKLGSIVVFIIMFSTTGCAVKKNPWMKKHSQASRVNATQLGRNRYYFSVNYQKKLKKSYKK